MRRPRVVVGVSGASGAPYAERLLRQLHGRAEVSLVFTRTGSLVFKDETGLDPRAFAEELGFPTWGPMDMTAPFASGSARYDAMVVCPCSVGQVARIAAGLSADLVGRAADVMLKERRPLLLVVRESPYGLVHLRNMVAVTEAGATVIPASPSFYSHPKDVPALLDTVTARVLDHLGIDQDVMPRWDGTLRGAE